MKCTNNKYRFISLFLCMLLLVCSGCGKEEIDLPFSTDSKLGAVSTGLPNIEVYPTTFAADLCVVTGDVSGSITADLSKSESAALFAIDNNKVIYAKNVHERMNPASLTKIMTAIVALKYGSLDQRLVAGNSVIINEKGAQLCGIKPGDTMTLEQALNILLLYSANDISMLIAENIGGTPEHFIDLMNQEAALLGATNTHFANPHGLTNEEHYTSAYDLYLIFQEATKYDAIMEIINKNTYETVYYDAAGNSKDLNIKTTNLYIRGERSVPENVTVIGGKTGTTAAAGHCLILLSKDQYGQSYISVILKSESGDSLYADMTNLLSGINN